MARGRDRKKKNFNEEKEVRGAGCENEENAYIAMTFD
jgi:hypothetical protein